MKAECKRFLLGLLYRGWGRQANRYDGYTVVIPVPMDMPFLTFFALKTLSYSDLTHCREIIIAPDGFGSDGGQALEEAINLANMENVRLLPAYRRNRTTITMFGDSGIAHWMAIVEAVRVVETDWIFLHDADAFLTESSLIESNYFFAKKNQLETLGVTTRWDPDFQKLGVELPGTWEMFFSTAWAKKWSPIQHKAGPRNTKNGRVFFDTMLYPQYRSYNVDRIKIKHNDSFIHLSGTVVTYRRYLDYYDKRVGDELFRLLFLSLLKELAPLSSTECRLPSVADLGKGLSSIDRKIHYCFPDVAENYLKFRDFISKMLETAAFSELIDKANVLLKPFDTHFSLQPCIKETKPVVKMRSHGLWLGE